MKSGKAKIASDASATESDRTCEGYPYSTSSETALERWLLTEGVARYDAYKRDPQGKPTEQVFKRLRQHHARRTKRDTPPL